MAHGRNIPFLPVLEMLRGYFGVTGDDSEEAAQRKIADTLLLLDPALTEMVPLMLDFLGVPDPERPSPQMDAEARQRQLLGLVKRVRKEPLPLRAGEEPRDVGDLPRR